MPKGVAKDPSGLKEHEGFGEKGSYWEPPKGTRTKRTTRRGYERQQEKERQKAQIEKRAAERRLFQDTPSPSPSPRLEAEYVDPETTHATFEQAEFVEAQPERRVQLDLTTPQRRQELPIPSPGVGAKPIKHRDEQEKEKLERASLLAISEADFGQLLQQAQEEEEELLDERQAHIQAHREDLDEFEERKARAATEQLYGTPEEEQAYQDMLVRAERNRKKQIQEMQLEERNLMEQIDEYNSRLAEISDGRNYYEGSDAAIIGGMEEEIRETQEFIGGRESMLERVRRRMEFLPMERVVTEPQAISEVFNEQMRAQAVSEMPLLERVGAEDDPGQWSEEEAQKEHPALEEARRKAKQAEKDYELWLSQDERRRKDMDLRTRSKEFKKFVRITGRYEKLRHLQHGKGYRGVEAHLHSIEQRRLSKKDERRRELAAPPESFLEAKYESGSESEGSARLGRGHVSRGRVKLERHGPAARMRTGYGIKQEWLSGSESSTESLGIGRYSGTVTQIKTEPGGRHYISPEPADEIPEEDAAEHQPQFRARTVPVSKKKLGLSQGLHAKNLRRKIHPAMASANFSLKKVGPTTYVLSAKNVTHGVVSQIRALMLKVPGKRLEVDGRIFARQGAFREIIRVLIEKGSVEISLG